MERPLTSRIRRGGEPMWLAEYEQHGGYEAARKAVREMTPQDVVSEVKDSSLRGRGGAGFPTGVKWSFMPPPDQDARRPRYLAVNADEMEPGTFKDRFLMEGDPHQLIEAIIIASFAIQAEVAYIFLRWAYKLAAARLERAIGEAEGAGYLGKGIFGSSFNLEVHLHTSAGRYICGEETALLTSLEGGRGIPRAKPPYPAQVGLWGRPTTVNNVETLCNVPHILLHGADWYKGLSRVKDGGTKIYGVSGRVQRPGSWELPLGTTLGEVLEEHAGGMQDGYALKGVLPGGASTAFLTAEHMDQALDFSSLHDIGASFGTGNLIVLDDHTCPVGMVLNLERFFARESCGWCTPCREGLPWIVRILEALEGGDGRPEDLEVLGDHVRRITMGTTFCALAPGAMEPLRSGLEHYRDDFERHLSEGGCPWRG
jgi:NADH-quinone oxidoreductase subunit F